MVKLTYRLHKIATFVLPFPKTPMFPTFDAIMAIWLYGHMAIMASNGHIAIWPLWRQRWPLWVFSETAIKMWQSGEDGKSIWPSCLKWEQKWTGGIFSFVFFRNSFVNAKSGGHNSFFIESTWNFCWWFLTHSVYYLKLGREFLNTFTNYETPLSVSRAGKAWPKGLLGGLSRLRGEEVFWKHLEVTSSLLLTSHNP